MSDPIPLDIAGLLPSAGVYGRTLSGQGAGKIMTAAELRAAAGAYSSAQVDTLLLGKLSLTGGTLTGSLSANGGIVIPNGGSIVGSGVAAWSLGDSNDSLIISAGSTSFSNAITGTSGLIQQRSGLTAQAYEIFETFTSSTNYGSLCLKATSGGHQIGSARGTSGSNRALQLGHYDASDTFAAAISIATTGAVEIGGAAAAPVLHAFSGSATTTIAAGSGMSFRSNANNANDVCLALFGTSATMTSGSNNVFALFQRSFAPTSGTARYSWMEFRPIVHQTGGANGITRGIFINPTLTAAADWRAIEVAAGKSVFQALEATTITHVPAASVTLTTNGQFSVEMTSNTAGNLVYRGSDGTTRRMALTFS